VSSFAGFVWVALATIGERCEKSEKKDLGSYLNCEAGAD
jgi:hypothetical protein